MSRELEDTAFVFRERPHDFLPAVEVASCHIEFQGKYLLLKRAAEKPEGGKWGMPGGKMEPGESSLEAAIRETYEETGIVLDEKRLKFVGELFVRKPDVDFIYNMFHSSLDHMPDVHLNNEHQEYIWLYLSEIKGIPIMSGGIEALTHFKDLMDL